MSAACTELYTYPHWLQKYFLSYQMWCKDLVYPHLVSSHRLILKICVSRAYDASYNCVPLYNDDDNVKAIYLGLMFLKAKIV